jgi:S1-C subfamily serine protease
VGGDILTAVDGLPLQKWEDLRAYLEERAVVGQEVSLNMIRNGEEMTFRVTLADTPESVQSR